MPTEKERMRQIILEQQEQNYNRENLRQWRKWVLFTLLGALLFGMIEFARYLPFYPKSAFDLKTCTLISMEYGTGRDFDRYSIFQDADGNVYRIPASFRDHDGRETELYTFYSQAIRTQYELPRALAGRALIAACILMLLAFETIYYIKYRQWQKTKLLLRGKYLSKSHNKGGFQS